MRGDEARIADYLLGELPETERAAVELRIARDPAFAESVERMRAVVEGLGAVPPGGWPSDAPSGAPPLPPLPGLSRPRQPAWRALRPAQAVAIAVALVAVGVAIGVLVSRGGDDPRPQGAVLALARLGDAGPTARGEARVVGGDETGLRLDVSGLAPSDGAYYELWLLDGPDRIARLLPRTRLRTRGDRRAAARAGRGLPLHRRLARAGRREPQPLRRLRPAGIHRRGLSRSRPTPGVARRPPGFASRTAELRLCQTRGRVGPRQTG